MRRFTRSCARVFGYIRSRQNGGKQDFRDFANLETRARNETRETRPAPAIPTTSGSGERRRGKERSCTKSKLLRLSRLESSLFPALSTATELDAPRAKGLIRSPVCVRANGTPGHAIKRTSRFDTGPQNAKGDLPNSIVLSLSLSLLRHCPLKTAANGHFC